jgi:hypothetical protein
MYDELLILLDDFEQILLSLLSFSSMMFHELLCHFDLPRFYKFLKIIIIYKFYQQSDEDDGSQMNALLLLVLIPHRRRG